MILFKGLMIEGRRKNFPVDGWVTGCCDGDFTSLSID